MPAATQTKVNTAVKALETEGRVGGYLVVWGDPSRKDLQGEYFTSQTDLALDWYPRRPALYHHGLDDTIKNMMVGQIDTMRPDDTGVWVEAQLDMRNRWSQAIYKLAKDGKLGWSSGSLPHMVQVERDGKITRWPIVEGSMTPTPAEPRHTEVSAKHLCDVGVIETAYKSVGLNVSGLLKTDSAIEGETREGQSGKGDTAHGRQTNLNLSMKRESTMTITDVTAPAITEEQQRALWQKFQAEEAEKKRQADMEAKAAKVDALEAENMALKAQTGAGQPAKRLPGRTEEFDEEQRDPAAKTARITVGSRFDNLTIPEMAFGVEMMHQLARINNNPTLRPSEQYANALEAKVAAKSMSVVKPDGTAYKANELSHSTQASYGDEWVPDMWSSELWRRARLDNVILPLFRSIEMPSNPYELPIQATDPTVYFVPETTAESELLISGAGAVTPDTKIGSGKVTLSAKKLALRVGFGAELVEDSIIPILPIYTEQALRAMSDGIDHLLLNGDTEAGGTGNINSDDGAPTATNKYMALDGLRKLPLVTTAANKVDASGGPTLTNLRAARFTMDGKYSLRLQDLAWIVDASTYAKLLSLPEVLTNDKFGPQATVMTGEIGKLDGTPVLVSAEMGLTEADGKKSATPGNNTKGQAICVYRPGWVVGYRRRVSASAVYIPYYDAWQLVATVRIAFIPFDADVSSALYNITV